MRLLHNIGERINSNYTPREAIQNCDEILTFDGIYRNVYQNQDVLEGKQVIFFVMGDHVGGDNAFDAPMPLELYCTWDEIIEMAHKYKAEIGWHTWSHRDLTTLSYEEIVKEVTPPFPMKKFAYPYGRFNDDVIRAVREAGYEEAFSVVQGDGSIFQRLRAYL